MNDIHATFDYEDIEEVSPAIRAFLLSRRGKSRLNLLYVSTAGSAGWEKQFNGDHGTMQKVYIDEYKELSAAALKALGGEEKGDPNLNWTQLHDQQGGKKRKQRRPTRFRWVSC